MTQCKGWDEDAIYYPRRIGVYLRVDTLVWWLPEGGSPILLPYHMRTISVAGEWLAGVNAQGDSVYLFKAGGLLPYERFTLPCKINAMGCLSRGKSAYLYGGGANVIWQGKFESKKNSWEWSQHSQRIWDTITGVVVSPAFVGVGSASLLRVYQPGERMPFHEVRLPGRLKVLWVGSPSEVGGIVEIGDMPYNFSYDVFARFLEVDTLQRARYHFCQYSPYFHPSFGVEYIGLVRLSAEGLLTPGGFTNVRSFSADFLGGRVFFLRGDSVWEASLTTPTVPPHFHLSYSGAEEIEVVAVYRYGSAEFTMR
ncbi:MAG: hypothetical protein RMJ66_08160 [Bacteroidia bacterium]|nr:hypothetical protein [Bacteroidia bacterium]MDW8135020.1 hypothetical protein [Bacteroidia bacterium]